MRSSDPSVANVTQKLGDRYPREIGLGDDTLQLRLMGESDVDALLKFARTLSPEDLLYLRVNITDAAAIGQWVEEIKNDRAVTIVALRGSEVVGEATLLHNATSWTRHLGEIRIQVSPSARRHGLARQLAAEIETIARELKLRLLTARMTLDQAEAQSVFSRLGFQREAVLWDYAITSDGKTRNVLVATKRL